MSNSVEENPQALVTDNEQQRSSPTRRVAAYHSDIDAGRSHAFIDVLKQVDRASGTNSPVLLTGESPTGKLLVASAIHHHSLRSDQPFLAVNCCAIPVDLIEAELFGSSTGDDPSKRGLLEQAEGGTVFLDEITETNPSFQVKLLRVLQTGEFSRVGSEETEKTNVRVIAASGRNVEQKVAAGRFQDDLFQALNALSIDLPSAVHDDAVKQSEAPSEDWVSLSVIEGRYVARVLQHTGGNKQAAARVLEIDRKTLDRMIKRHHIDCHPTRGQRAKASVTS